MKVLTYLVSIILAQLAGILGSVFTITGVNSWYATINKPSWNPPSWLFGPVWISLYTLMGISAALVWQNRNAPGAKQALWFYFVQLMLNALWSILFFGQKNPGLAFVEIIILLIFIIITTVLFWKINRTAGALLLPYIAWVSFASILNFTIWRLN